MKGNFVVTLTLAAALLAAPAGTFAVTNGQHDGNAHPAVGFLLASIGPDFCSLSNQLVGCSGELITPDLILTSGECTFRFQRALAEGRADRVWVDFNPDTTLNCADFVPIDTGGIFTNPAFDPNSNSISADVGVMRLLVPQAAPPVTLPPENLLESLPGGEPYTVVAFGALFPFDRDSDTARRFDFATSVGLAAETLSVLLDPGQGPEPACIGFQNEGGAVLRDGTNEIVALVIEEVAPGCAPQARDQRLDVASVRTFLAQFVLLP